MLRTSPLPLGFAAFVGAGLLLERDAGGAGALALGVLTWVVLLAACARLDRDERRRVAALVAVATAGEVLGSLILELYAYRHGGIPAFVPPGHGLVYLTGLSLTQTSLVSRHQRAFLAAVGAVAVAWAVAGLTVLPRTDASGALGMAVFLVFLFRGRVPALYGSVFLVVAVLEISGTALGVWAWKDVVPGLQLPSGNPPSGAASGYVLFDIVAIAVTARLLRLFQTRRVQPAS
jgi:hypothetical protein